MYMRIIHSTLYIDPAEYIYIVVMALYEIQIAV